MRKLRQQGAISLSEQRYEAFIQNSSEGIWCLELETQIDLTASPQDQIDCLYRDAFVIECNDALARMLGFAHRKQVIGMRLGNLMPRLSSGNVDLLLEFIRSGYRIIERESQELSRNAEVMVFLGSLTGVIQDGSLCRISRLGRADLNPVALNMNRLLDGVIATLKTQAGQVGVTFEIGELPPFRGDDDGHAELVQRNLVEAMIHADAVQLRQAHVLSELC